ncbi:MAG: short-chain fatty acyl-CoA regulator family protein [Pseudomonadota bacterium]
MRKTLVGPRLRQLRREHGHTQSEMAAQLSISPAYVNLLENNQRSLSVQVLMALTEGYGVDWRDLINDNDVTRLADLRAAVRDPMFPEDRPDLQELRAAIDHAPKLVDHFLKLYQSHRAAVDRFMSLTADDVETSLVTVSPETAIHDFFRTNGNYFDVLEQSAFEIRREMTRPADDIYADLKDRLLIKHGVSTSIARITDMPDTLRDYDAAKTHLTLSEALDYPNRIFQMSHVLCLLECGPTLDDLLKQSALKDPAALARCRVELANYFAAALLMPYEEILYLAQRTQYDLDRIGAAFGVSVEQVCHRLTTLQRDGARGVPMFFLRIDKAGNVTKRFNATAFQLAEQGGACPVWNIHRAFRDPGITVPQFVEMPDGGQFFTFSRTTDRPVFSRQTQDRRLVITLGCERSHASKIGYANAFRMDQPNLFAPIGINCHLCPRQACSQRAHQPLHMSLPMDTNRRGNTRYES